MIPAMASKLMPPRAADLRDDAVEQLGRRLREHLRTHDAEGRREDGEHDGDGKRNLELAHETHELRDGSLEVLRLLAGHHPRTRSVRRTAALRHFPQILNVLAHRAPPPASSSSDNWDMAISRYSSQLPINSACVPLPTTRPHRAPQSGRQRGRSKCAGRR